MSFKIIDEIINKSTNRNKDFLKSAFLWLIPKKHISKGVRLLVKHDFNHLKALITFNEEIRIAILYETLKVENYLNTVVYNWFKKRLEDIETIIFVSEVKKNHVRNIFKNDKKWNQKDFDELFDNLTFGKKREVISCFSDITITKCLLIGNKFSKSEYLKSLQLIVELRNKADHHPFLAYPEFISSMTIQPRGKAGIESISYFFERIDGINKIFDKVGFEKKIKRIAKKI